MFRLHNSFSVPPSIRAGSEEVLAHYSLMIIVRGLDEGHDDRVSLLVVLHLLLRLHVELERIPPGRPAQPFPRPLHRRLNLL